jgi:uncharacterized membrane protein
MSRPTDHDLDLSIAAMLRFGVTLAAIIVIIGGALYLRHPLSATPDLQHFQAGVPSLTTISGIITGVIHLSPPSIIQFGMVILIATPVARVLLCVIGFARQKDRLYVFISSFVLLVLIYSLSKGSH